MLDQPDGMGGFVRTAQISGINVQIVNGLGATNEYPDDPNDFFINSVTNGVGNLIVGYGSHWTTRITCFGVGIPAT